MQLSAEQITNDILAIRKNAPLVHNITNYVVMNNTANALLALGASPVMAHAEEEVQDMVKIASALVINIGTLSPAWIRAMVKAAETAKQMSIPIVLDPVGAGATPYRTQAAMQIIRNTPPDIIRGNGSEIMALNRADVTTKGVDSSSAADQALDAAASLNAEYGSIVCITGAVDYIVDSNQTTKVFNGHEMMPKVTGLGCTASALCGAFASVTSDMHRAAAHAMAVMGMAGEMAAQTANGPGSFQVAFIDALYRIDGTQAHNTRKI